MEFILLVDILSYMHITVIIGTQYHVVLDRVIMALNCVHHQTTAHTSVLQTRNEYSHNHIKHILALY